MHASTPEQSYRYRLILSGTIIRGEPEQASNTQETGSGSIHIYIFIYLWVILHGNDLMHMLKHHLLERDW